MKKLPGAFAPLSSYAQFILYQLVPGNVKTLKIPINPHTKKPFAKGVGWQDDSTMWTTFEHAASQAGDQFRVGYILTKSDPFWFIDVDECVTDGAWNHIATELLVKLRGCAVEMSQSGRGIHIIGSGPVPPHAHTNGNDLGLYTHHRFIALTGVIHSGNAGHCGPIGEVAAAWFPPKERGQAAEWTSEPVEGYTEPDDIVEKMLSAASSANNVYGADGVTLRDLWECNDDALAARWPPDKGANDSFNRSEADASLAQRLMFWAGGNCERVKELMQESQLVRPKWDQADYLDRTILHGAGLCKGYYNTTAPIEGAPKLKGSPAQVALAERVRAAVLGTATPEQKKVLLKQTSASMWANNKGATAEQIATAVTPMAGNSAVFIDEVQVLNDWQFMPYDLQLEHFKGCVYVAEENKVFTPGGRMVGRDTFNILFGGYEFQMDSENRKTTKKAWEAFTESQKIRWPKVAGTCFKPLDDPGGIVEIDGETYVNTYQPLNRPVVAGDASIFTEHVAKLIPDQRDRVILMSYLAACLQYVGHKFLWAPLVQGVEGNGKTVLSEIIAHHIGLRKYAFSPIARELAEKHNDWLKGKLFIYVEDIKVGDKQEEILETMKPWMTSGFIAYRGMGVSQTMGDNYSNWILNSNYKNAMRTTRDARRYGIFFCAQQRKEDLARDGIDKAYLKRLNNWLKRENGYAIAANYLLNYDIPMEFNPCLAVGGEAYNAPVTSSTEDAIQESLGSAEQAILEAVGYNNMGFCGGWISAYHLGAFLKEENKGGISRRKRAEMLKTLGYEPHPGLVKGKSGKAIALDGSKRSILYIHRDNSIAMALKGADAVRAYEAAQAKEEAIRTAASFGG